MEPSSLPVWAQAIFYLVVSLGAGVTGIISYAKKKEKDTGTTTLHGAPSSTASVISASFIDSKLLKDLIETLRELQDERSRDEKKSHRLSQDLRDSVHELNESIILQTDATENLVRFVNRDAARHNKE